MTDYYQSSKDQFLRDAGTHSMEVKQDGGLFRHLKFSRDGSSVFHFNITTWPGYLCISGDMGCFVFARTSDMFEFFRGDYINPDYWAEKIQATSKTSGHKAYNFDLLKSHIENDFNQWHFESEEQKLNAWKDIASEYSGLLYMCEGNSEDFALKEVMDYRCAITGNVFDEFYEHNLRDWTYHYLWCCQAIQWAIKQYDEAKA